MNKNNIINNTKHNQSLILRVIAILFATICVHYNGFGSNIHVMGLVFEYDNANVDVVDANGIPCATLKIAIPGNAEFEGNIIDISVNSKSYQVSATYDTEHGERIDTIKMNMNEYCVFLSDGAKFIRIKTPGYDPTLIVFNNYEIDKLRSNSVYSLHLSSISDFLNRDNRIKAITSQAINHYVNREYNEAIPLLREAAEAGNQRAQNFLGICYENGCGVLKNYKKAVEYYKLASAQGYADAILNLGNCYLYGNGVEKDESEAVRQYLKSAKQENESAFFNLGICYEFGMGVTQNFQQAYYWYAKSAQVGNETAQNKCNLLKKFIDK